MINLILHVRPQVKLIENSVKGKISVPPAAERSPAADLLRRILVPEPRSRYGIKAITAHPWFVTKLPTGALELNSSYLPGGYSQTVPRQSPDAIKQVIRSAVQVAGAAGSGVALSTSSATLSDWPDSPLGCSVHQSPPCQQQHSTEEGGGPSEPSSNNLLPPGHVPYQRLMSYSVVTVNQQQTPGSSAAQQQQHDHPQQQATNQPQFLIGQQGDTPCSAFNVSAAATHDIYPYSLITLTPLARVTTHM